MYIRENKPPQVGVSLLVEVKETKPGQQRVEKEMVRAIHESHVHLRTHGEAGVEVHTW